MNWPLMHLKSAVLHTRNGFRLHFIKGPGGRWHLAIVDLRKPCIS